MSRLKPILNRFNQCSGVIGSLVCSHDGMVIEADISERFNRDIISALISSAGLSVKTGCSGIDLDHFTSYHITASSGDIIISNLGQSYFVVFIEQGADTSAINVEIFQAGNEIKKSSVIG